MLKPLKDYPEYLVSDKGYIISTKTNKRLSMFSDKTGYQSVTITHNGKTKNVRVHVAVLSTFEPDHPIEKTQVNHIDGDKTNNSWSNLEWTTPQENIDHSKNVLGSYKSGGDNYNAKKIKAVNSKDATDILIFDSIIEAARYFNKNHEYKDEQVAKSIARAANKKRNTFRNFIWDFI